MFNRLSADTPEPFAVLHRPHLGDDIVEILFGELVTVERLADLPEPFGPEQPVLAVVPYRQIRERGFEAVDDGAPLLALRSRERVVLPLGDLLARLPDGPESFTETGYDVPDADYRQIVERVLAEEIAEGAGSNFVIHRCLTGRVDEPPAQAALGVLKRLLLTERRAYWTFVVHTPESTFVGATPERHVSVDSQVVRMNPISGTLRYPASGYADRDEHRKAVLAFLADPKERDELAMVVDEELKMMAVVGDRGGRVQGPYLKEMSRLAHTEYVLEGRTSLDVRQVLRATMFAPTVTGSPIRNACRVINRHERKGRRYYGGVLALISQDAHGDTSLDAPILIRTAEIAADGTVRVAAGATLVRGSQPESELAETRTKAAAIVNALSSTPKSPATPDSPTTPELPVIMHGCTRATVHDHGKDVMAEDPEVLRVLADRNRTLAHFWLHEAVSSQPDQAFSPGITVIDAEDDFTGMLAHLLESLGHTVAVHAWDAPEARHAAEQDSGLLVLGPGPGDPRDQADPRIGTLHGFARARLAAGAPVLGVCLGHQILADTLGLRVARLAGPDQGRQTGIELFGDRCRVGFYNSFVVQNPLEPTSGLDFSLDSRGERVHALRGEGVTGLQFHPESVLTTEGRRILATELDRLAQPHKTRVQE